MRSIPKTWVREGGMVQLSKKHLKAEYKGASDSEIVYIIQSDNGQPQHGTAHSLKSLLELLPVRVSVNYSRFLCACFPQRNSHLQDMVIIQYSSVSFLLIKTMQYSTTE